MRLHISSTINFSDVPGTVIEALFATKEFEAKEVNGRRWIQFIKDEVSHYPAFFLAPGERAPSVWPEAPAAAQEHNAQVWAVMVDRPGETGILIEDGEVAVPSEDTE